MGKITEEQEQETNGALVYPARDWRPQHRAAAIVRLERLERAVAKHDETLRRINALLDLATSARYADGVAPRTGGVS